MMLGNFADIVDDRDARFMVKLPDNMDFKVAAPLMCAGVTIYGGIIRANLPKGASVGIVGIGGLGHIGTQVAKCMVRYIITDSQV